MLCYIMLYYVVLALYFVVSVLRCPMLVLYCNVMYCAVLALHLLDAELSSTEHLCYLQLFVAIGS